MTTEQRSNLNIDTIIKYIKNNGPCILAGILLFSFIYHFSTVQADGYYYLDGGKRMLETLSLPDRE